MSSSPRPSAFWQQRPTADASAPRRQSFPARLLDVVFAVLLALVVVVLAAIHVGPLLGLRPIGITGDVMRPALPHGTAVLARDIPFDGLRTGDLALLHASAPGPVVRRIVEVRALGPARPDVYFVVTADAAPEADERLVRAIHVLGRVDAAIPLLGHLVSAGTSQLGTWVLLSLIGSLVTLRLLIDEVVRPGSEWRRRSRASGPGARTAR